MMIIIIGSINNNEVRMFYRYDVIIDKKDKAVDHRIKFLPE